MTYDEAVKKAQRISEVDYYVFMGTQPYNGGVLTCYTVHIDGVASHSSKSFEACFAEVARKIAEVGHGTP